MPCPDTVSSQRTHAGTASNGFSGVSGGIDEEKNYAGAKKDLCETSAPIDSRCGTQSLICARSLPHSFDCYQ